MEQDRKTKPMAQWLYLIALGMLVFSMTLYTTMFRQPFHLHWFCDEVFWMLMVVKMALYDRNHPVYLLISALLLGVSQVIFVVTGEREPFYLTMAVVAARGVDFRKILKVCAYVTLAVVAAAFVASLTGYIENLRYYTEGRGYRNSFGIVYTTDFAAHIFFLMLNFFYAYREKLKGWHYVAALAVAAAVYVACKARIDVACMLLLLAGYGGFTCYQRAEHKFMVPDRLRKISRAVMTASMPLAAIIMTALTLLYTKGSAFWSAFPESLQLRFLYGQQGLERYSFTPFGQQVTLIGQGGQLVYPENYFFIDCSYLYCFLLFGAVFLVLVLAAYVLCCMKYRDDFYLMYAVMLTALNCMIEHHLTDIAYCVFVLALFSEKKGFSKTAGLGVRLKRKYDS